MHRNGSPPPLSDPEKKAFSSSFLSRRLWPYGEREKELARSPAKVCACPSPPFPRTSVIKLPPARETGADIESGKTFAKAKIKKNICNDHCFFSLTSASLNKFDKLFLKVWRIFLPDLPPAPPLLPSSNESPEPLGKEEEWKRLCRKGTVGCILRNNKRRKDLIRPLCEHLEKEGRRSDISECLHWRHLPRFPACVPGGKGKKIQIS